MKQTLLSKRRLEYEPAETTAFTLNVRNVLCTSTGSSSIGDLQEETSDNTFWD